MSGFTVTSEQPRSDRLMRPPNDKALQKSWLVRSARAMERRASLLRLRMLMLGLTSMSEQPSAARLTRPLRKKKKKKRLAKARMA